ncbi:hypothetical protein DVH24_025765 [Malus domestica]|uniref:Uncharacterized protein n=1 Tax=Malus domestica TaxID=3750 RepID=A0A498KEP8_MALDO|nr:hypothetical protein DVH24_025765 [Malus domestica]
MKQIPSKKWQVSAKLRKQDMWENDELKAFLIFPSGVRYVPEMIRDKATFPIFLQNFPKEKSTSNLACKSDDVFPKPTREIHAIFATKISKEKKRKQENNRERALKFPKHQRKVPFLAKRQKGIPPKQGQVFKLPN